MTTLAQPNLTGHDTTGPSQVSLLVCPKCTHKLIRHAKFRQDGSGGRCCLGECPCVFLREDVELLAAPAGVAVAPAARYDSDSVAAAAGKTQGMARAQSSASETTKQRVRDVIDEHVAAGGRFSANTIREQLPDDTGRGLVGSLLNGYAARRPRVIVQVGEEPSRLPSTHNKPIAVWQAAPTSEDGAR